MKLASIPNDKIQGLPLETRLFIHILDENRWTMCTVTAAERGKGLIEEGTNWVLTYCNDTEGFLVAYRCDEEEGTALATDKINELKNIATQARTLYEVCADMPIDFPSAERFVWTMGELKDALIAAGY